jgi:hypothetical protein
MELQNVSTSSDIDKAKEVGVTCSENSSLENTPSKNSLNNEKVKEFMSQISKQSELEDQSYKKKR